MRPQKRNYSIKHTLHSAPFARQTASPLWLPSQNGGFFVCLQLHSHTFCFSARTNFFGKQPVPLWLKSHIG